MINKISLKRLLNSKEISHAVLFILEDDGITGQIITVDGGINL